MLVKASMLHGLVVPTVAVRVAFAVQTQIRRSTYAILLMQELSLPTRRFLHRREESRRALPYPADQDSRGQIHPTLIL